MNFKWNLFFVTYAPNYAVNIHPVISRSRLCNLSVAQHVVQPVFIGDVLSAAYVTSANWRMICEQ
jgi:hypothetical protein